MWLVATMLDHAALDVRKAESTTFSHKFLVMNSKNLYLKKFGVSVTLSCFFTHSKSQGRGNLETVFSVESREDHVAAELLYLSVLRIHSANSMPAEITLHNNTRVSTM